MSFCEVSSSLFLQFIADTRVETQFWSRTRLWPIHLDAMRDKSSYYALFFCEVSSQRKNIWKTKFFPDQEKSGNFVDGQGNLERT